MSYTIADYTFTSTTNTLPVFNDGYVYTYTDTVDTTNGTTRRIIVAEEYPSSISFKSCGELLRVDELAITDKITSMREAFHTCGKLTSVYTGNWDTSKVTDIFYIFRHCGSLVSLDVSNWDTSSMINICASFEYCSNLQSLDASNWDTSNVTKISWMFNGCSNLQSLDASNWDTSNVTDMSNMFSSCSNLQSLDVSNWDTGNVISMSNIFTNVSKLQTLRLNNTLENTKTKLINQLPNSTNSCKIWSDSISSNNQTLLESKGYVYKESKLIADYTFTSTTDTLPVFNAGYVYTYTDTVDTTNGTTRRIIVAEEYPSSISFSNCGELLTVESLAITDKITSMQDIFIHCAKVQYINTDEWDTSNIKTFQGAFYGCSSLTSLDISSFNTSKVTNMAHMFNSCKNLTSLDVSQWETSNVTNMYGIFIRCNNLTTLDVSNWDTSKVTDMFSMFFECTNLKSLDVSNWNTSKVTGMKDMFSNCASLISLDVSNWDVSKVTNMFCVFNSCTSLSSLNLSNWNINNATTLLGLFGGCTNLTSLDLSNWNISNVVDMNSIFTSVTKLQTLMLNNTSEDTKTKLINGLSNSDNSCKILSNSISNDNKTLLESKGYVYKDSKLIADYTFTSTTDTLPAFNDGCVYTYYDKEESEGITRRVIYAEEYPSSISFNDCNELLTIESVAITDKVIDINHMFSNCNKLTTLNVSNWDTSKVTNMNAMFNNCTSLTTLDLSNWNTSNVTNMYYAFATCRNLQSLDLSNWNTSNVTNMASMFYNCTNIKSLDVSNWNTSNITNMSHMFNGCSNLSSLDVSNWNTSKVTNMSSMFYNCNSLTMLDLFKWNTSQVTNMSSMFNGCNSLITLDVSNFDTSKVTNMSYMFNGCTSLASLDVSSWDTSKVNNIIWMFNGCTSLTSLDVSNFNTSNVTSMGYVFNGCKILTTLDLSNFNTTNVTSMINIFGSCSKLTNIGMLYANTSTVNIVLSALPTTNAEDINVWIQDAKTSDCVIPEGAKIKVKNVKIEEKEISLNEPLRGLPNGVRDKIVHKNNKWYVERNCTTAKNTTLGTYTLKDEYPDVIGFYLEFETKITGGVNIVNNILPVVYTPFPGQINRNTEGVSEQGGYIKGSILKSKLTTPDLDGIIKYFKNNNAEFVCQLETPTYEEITSPQLITYLDKTYINVNSTIPTNIQVSNSGIELQGIAPNSTYTLAKDIVGTSSNAVTVDLAGKEQVVQDQITTGDTVNNYMKLYGKGITYKNVMLLDGVENNYGSYFQGLRSSFDTVDNNGKYPVKVKVHGKNLVNIEDVLIKNNVDYSTMEDGIIYFKAHANLWNYGIVNFNKCDVTASYYAKIKGSCTNFRIAFVYADGTFQNASYVKTPTDDFVKVTIKSKPGKIIERVRFDWTTYGEIYIHDFQIEEGTEATEYEPYYEDTKTIYLNSPLLQGDELVNREDGVYHVHNYEKVVLDENITLNSSSTVNEGIYRWQILGWYGKQSGMIYSTNYKSISAVDTWRNYKNGITLNSVGYQDGRSAILIYDDRFNDGSDISKESLKNELIGTSIVYQLNTPTEEKVSDTPLNLIATTNAIIEHNSIIPVENTTTKNYQIALNEISPNTLYTVILESFMEGNNCTITFGGISKTFKVKEGYNMISFKTNDNPTNIVEIDGQYVNIKKITIEK